MKTLIHCELRVHRRNDAKDNEGDHDYGWRQMFQAHPSLVRASHADHRLQASHGTAVRGERAPEEDEDGSHEPRMDCDCTMVKATIFCFVLLQLRSHLYRIGVMCFSHALTSF